MLRIGIVIIAVGLLIVIVGITLMIQVKSKKKIFPALVPLSDAQKFQLLKDEAEKRNLRWRIFCTNTYVDEPLAFLAVAEHKEATRGSTYTDEGRMDEWMINGDSQADAAYGLYKSIQGAPTHLAEKYFVREKRRERVERICPRIDSERPDTIPTADKEYSK